MDKPMATRLDEGVIKRIGLLATRLGVSKKAIIERAVLAYAEQIDAEAGTDVFEETCGAWRRQENAEQIVEQAKHAFRTSMQRHVADDADQSGEP